MYAKTGYAETNCYKKDSNTLSTLPLARIRGVKKLRDLTKQVHIVRDGVTIVTSRVGRKWKRSDSYDSDGVKPIPHATCDSHF